MPGTKRRLDEDTWIVSQSKKFKTGVSLSNVYDTTLAHLRMGARNFFSSLLRTASSSTPPSSPLRNIVEPASPAGTSSIYTAPPLSPHNSPPGSPLVRDVISDNELIVQAPQVLRPLIICQDCVIRSRRQLGTEEFYGKCAYCDKLVCHLNSCRGCGLEFCGSCSIAKYDDTNVDAHECYSCLN